MDFIDPGIRQYAEQHSTEEPPALREIAAYTHHHVHTPRMLSGHLQGRLLSMLSHMMRPASILEIGTYTGYSALCLAEGLAPGGRLTTIDNDPSLEKKNKGLLRCLTLGKANRLPSGRRSRRHTLAHGPL